MLRVQRWEPDTHDAVFDCQWDDVDPDAPHVCIAAVVEGLVSTDPQGAFEKALAENQAKNQAVQAVVEALPDEMKKPVLDSDGDPTGELIVKDKHQPRWSLDAEGRVTISVPGADAKLAAELDAAVPLAKVVEHVAGA